MVLFRKGKVAFFSGLLALGMLGSCENNSTPSHAMVVENSMGIFQLHRSFFSLVNAFAIGETQEIIHPKVEIVVLDSFKIGGYQILDIHFGEGTECKDGFKRSGHWQLQFNASDPRNADTFWLFLQEFAPDSMQINSGVGWKGRQINASGVYQYIQLSNHQIQSQSNIQWESNSFRISWQSEVISTQHNARDWIEAVSATFRYRDDFSTSGSLEAKDLMVNEFCAKSYSSGSASIALPTKNQPELYTIRFNPFGEDPTSCDEHAKLESGKLEKMFTLW